MSTAITHMPHVFISPIQSLFRLWEQTTAFILTASRLGFLFIENSLTTSLFNIVSPFLRSYAAISIESNSTFLYVMGCPSANAAG